MHLASLVSEIGAFSVAAVLGYATTVIPRWFTYYVSTALFFLFGLKMLKEGKKSACLHLSPFMFTQNGFVCCATEREF